MTKPLQFSAGGEASINAARLWIGRELFVNHAEVECPTCTRVARLDNRNFDRFRAYALVVFAAHLKVGEWTLTHEFVKTIDASLEKGWKSREWPRLQLWGFIEAQRKVTEECEGEEEEEISYRLTEPGRAAVFELTPVPKKVLSFKGVPRRYSEETTTVLQVLGRDQYDALLRKAGA